MDFWQYFVAGYNALRSCLLRPEDVVLASVSVALSARPGDRGEVSKGSVCYVLVFVRVRNVRGASSPRCLR